MRDSAWTIHVLTEMPSREAASSTFCFRASESRRVIRELRASSCCGAASSASSRTKTNSGSAPAKRHLDPAVLELVRELERRLAERLEEAAGERRLERHREELGGAGGRLVADRRDPPEILAECLDVAVDLHDGIMTS